MSRLLAALVLGSAALLAAQNSAADETMLILHVIPHEQRVHCYTPQEQGFVDPTTQTVTSVTTDSEIDVYVYLFGYESARGAAFRLVWPEDWQYFGWVGDCQDVQLTMTTLGPVSLQMMTAFNTVTGGGLAPVGFASFRSGGAGEVRLEATPDCGGGGICYLNGAGQEVTIESGKVGWIGIGGGYNPAAGLPVESATWGRIKASYPPGSER